MASSLIRLSIKAFLDMTLKGIKTAVDWHKQFPGRIPKSPLPGYI